MTINSTLGPNGYEVSIPAPVSGGAHTLQLALHATSTRVFMDRSPAGKYIFTGQSVDGNYFARLCVGVNNNALEDPTSLTVTQITAMDSGLKKSDGVTAIGSGVCNFDAAWWLSETRFICVGRGLGADSNKCYLFVVNFNGTAWTIGNNSPAFDNKSASVNLGTWSGGQATNVSALHARSGATDFAGKFLFGEYNISSGRVAGSTNDAVRVHQTTDSGATWTILLTWNTDGSTNQIRHCHGVVYNRYKKSWVILTGDDPDSAILEWDGVSASPAANTPLWNIRQTPGWRVYRDTVPIPGASSNSGIKARAGDIHIRPAEYFWMNDDTEANTDQPLAYAANAYGQLTPVRTGDYIRRNGTPPLLCLETPGGGAFWFSMIEQTQATDSPFGVYGYDIWHTPDGCNFFAVNFTKDNGNHGAGFASVIYNAFYAGEDMVILSGTPAKNSMLLPGPVGNAACGSLICKIQRFDGTIKGLRTTG